MVYPKCMRPIKPWLVFSMIIAFYLIWLFRAWIGYEYFELDSPLQREFFDITKLLWIPLSIVMIKIGLKEDKTSFLRLDLRSKMTYYCLLIGIIAPLLLIGLDYTINPARYNLNMDFSISFFLNTFFFASFLEELFFRGFLFSYLRQFLGFWHTQVIQSILFSMIHFGWWILTGSFGLNSAIYIVVVGLIWGYLRELSGSIWPSVLSHGIHNFVLDWFI